MIKKNKFQPIIECTQKSKINKSLPSYLIYSNYKLDFRVYCRPTNKKDLIIFYSHYNPKIKSGLFIIFHLRTLRICNAEYIGEEEKYIYIILALD